MIFDHLIVIAIKKIKRETHFYILFYISEQLLNFYINRKNERFILNAYYFQRR